MTLEVGILLLDQGVDPHCRVGCGLMEFIDIGTDGDETESLLRLAILSGVIGDRGCRGEFPQAREENREGT
ncbi:hypothetical protein SDC9_169059 [bioreactor metagenome]|uniref:Uncharacterized protein n=1 Tax=bioreactor metagenome TaxID=1076179 RepID=A0A645G7B1_9ZZZZ